MTPSPEDRWRAHDLEWRDPAEIVSDLQRVAVDPKLLRFEVRGAWWDVLAELDVCLLVSREYEHLLVGLATSEQRPHITFMPLAHPSGIAVDRGRGVTHVASTRNPNRVYRLAPVGTTATRSRPLVPLASRFYPGGLYLHELAFVGGDLLANAVGQNAVVRLDREGAYERVWWPRCIESDSGPRFDRNYLQLNSIGAGRDVASSFFSASAERISARRPGHRNFPVRGRGVVFSGKTREPVVRGLTRPHSARLHEDRLWVDNSGYGELGTVQDGTFVAVARLPGWVRGLCFRDSVAFVGTSRVIPRFRRYAPGLDVESSTCGVSAVDIGSGDVIGSIAWPAGNQVFSVEWLPRSLTDGFPFERGKRTSSSRTRALFYDFVEDPAGDRRA